MDLQQEWNNLNGELAVDADSFTVDFTSNQKLSKNTYETLLKNLHGKLIWIKVLALPPLIGAFYTEGLLRYLLLAFFVTYAVCSELMQRKMKKLPNTIDYTAVSKVFIAEKLKLIKEILRSESWFTYLFGPFAGPIGLMCQYLVRYKTLDQIVLHHPNLIYYLLAASLLVIPMKILGDRMNNYAFGRDIEKLTANLEELEK
jgi:hypothetical protein